MQLRSMLRFTIRDVLWLILVVGLAVGWRVDRGRLEDWEYMANMLATLVRGEGGTVDFDDPEVAVWLRMPPDYGR